MNDCLNIVINYRSPKAAINDYNSFINKIKMNFKMKLNSVIFFFVVIFHKRVEMVNYSH